MTLTHALRYASILVVATVLAATLGSHSLRAQGTATPSAQADAKKKADAAKASAAKQAADKPSTSGNPQGYRPDPVTNY
jgi:hypothetical protein